MNNNDIYSSSKAEKRANSSNKKKSRIIAAVLAAVALIAIICLLCFKGCTPDESNPAGKFLMDDNAVEGGWDEADIDEIKKGLNEKVEAGMINISMNTSPVFENGSSEGNLMIVNEEVNIYRYVTKGTFDAYSLTPDR